MKNDPVLFSSNYCHCEGAGYAEVSSAPILNLWLLPKLNLERAEGEKVMRLQNRSDALEKEVALLRKKSEGERESHMEAVKGGSHSYITSTIQN